MEVGSCKVWQDFDGNWRLSSSPWGLFLKPLHRAPGDWQPFYCLQRLFSAGCLSKQLV